MGAAIDRVARLWQKNRPTAASLCGLSFTSTTGIMDIQIEFLRQIVLLGSGSRLELSDVWKTYSILLYGSPTSLPRVAVTVI